MSDRLDKILEKVTATQIDVALLQKDMESYIKRTEGLESKVDTASVPIVWFRGTLRVLMSAALMVGIAKGVKEFL